MHISSTTAPERFRHFIRDAAHPCAMAKSVLANDAIDFRRYDALGDRASAIATCEGLYASLRQPHADGYWSHVALFPDEVVTDERDFETRLWTHLQRMHEHDAALHEWDPAVSADPQDARFSFSIGGRAWYVIGLHPRASRLARRHDSVALVFNPHAQFDDLRTRGKYSTVRNLIRQRDVRLQGSVNPMLADHGEASEARQYSGRAVPEGWRCPFHAAR